MLNNYVPCQCGCSYRAGNQRSIRRWRSSARAASDRRHRSSSPEEGGGAAVAALGDMMRVPRKNRARQTSHGEEATRNNALTSARPLRCAGCGCRLCRRNNWSRHCCWPSRSRPPGSAAPARRSCRSPSPKRSPPPRSPRRPALSRQSSSLPIAHPPKPSRERSEWTQSNRDEARRDGTGMERRSPIFEMQPRYILTVRQTKIYLSLS